MANRDPEATRARILDAALHEFSAKGIAGARVDAIAERAGVNKRMLYYYFESKEGLFREILRRRLVERSGIVGAVIGDGDQLAARVARIAEDPEHTRLLLWEALELDPEQPVNEDLRRSFYAEWVAAVEAEQRAGRVPDDVDPAQVVLTEICLALGPFLLPQVSRLLTGTSIDDPAFVAGRQEHLRVMGVRLMLTRAAPS